MPLGPDHQTALTLFIASISDIRWLGRTGEPDPWAIVCLDLVDAWDGWNAEMLKAWLPESQGLERIAVTAISDAGVNEVFETVSRIMGDLLWRAIEQYFISCSTDFTSTDRGLAQEWLGAMKRDLSWAAVEAILSRPGFFTGLLKHYRAGRWPCAYEDGDTKRRVVVL